MVERANFLECLLIYFDKWGLALMLVLTLESDSIAMAMVPPITKPWVEVRGTRDEALELEGRTGVWSHSSCWYEVAHSVGISAMFCIIYTDN